MFARNRNNHGDDRGTEDEGLPLSSAILALVALFAGISWHHETGALWRDRYGEVHAGSFAKIPALYRDRVPWREVYWYDEIMEGPMPGRVDFR